MTEFNTIQTIKRRFFAMRNGIVADTLRRAGSPFKIIFGLNMPQISEIASDTKQDPDLARQLWANSSTRESMLMAPMIMPANAISVEESMEWIAKSPSSEVTDVLCHRLLRHHPMSYEMACRMSLSDSDMQRYGAMRLLWHHLTQHPDTIKIIAQSELNRKCMLTHQPAIQIIEELDFMAE